MTSRTGVVAPFAYNEVHPNGIRAEVSFDGVNKVEGKAKQWYLGFIRISGGNKYFEDKNTKLPLFGRRIKKAQSWGQRIFPVDEGENFMGTKFLCKFALL